ncbi:uncharacterized protein LOC121507731 isoform X1 [Xyrichtys novacula]|uniref:Uncharacterized protein LOC121507731 isoform X1 n=1 Tax=Xyrichtys novacula TaxID=13765 RepID=A0AAV1EUH4_XYRNO|nr:uncharacterized protein LOC121507731 isoform X1 [Xyrichtys novacula]
MDRLHLFLVVLPAIVSLSCDCVCGSVSEMTVKPGGNITLYCDCKILTGVYIVWYRNCSHENQPPLVLKPKRGFFNQKDDFNDLLTIFDRFQFVSNISSKSYDLLIQNVSDSDEGLYYCGTGQRSVEVKEGYIVPRDIYSDGNVTTRIIVRTHSDNYVMDVPVVSWLMPFIPAITVLSIIIPFTLAFHFCQITESQSHKTRPYSRARMSQHQDEDLYLTRVVFQLQDGQTQQ